MWTMNNWQWDHVAQQNPATIYPTGWLEAYKHKRLRSEWRYFVSRVKARQWRSARNTFNGYLAEHDGHRCVVCGAPDQLTLDHIQPYSQGGSDTLNNLRTLCKTCNSRRGAARISDEELVARSL